RFLAAPRSRETRFLLAFPDVLFDQRRGKDRGEGQKQTADGRSEAGGNEPRDHGYRPAEGESDEILVAARLTQSGGVKLNDHESPNKTAHIPNATANQTTRAVIVAVQDDIVNFLSSTQTVQL